MRHMQKIKLLGVPFAFGQDRPGVKHAPDHCRSLGLASRLNQIAKVDDLGDIDFSLCRPSSPSLIKNQSACALGSELISLCIENESLKDSFLLNVGGDHGLALGTIHGVLEHRPETVVIWADAHGDINTPERSLSGNFHGMPLSFLLKGAQDQEGFQWLRHKILPEKLIFIGPRDLDPAEEEIIKSLSIQYYSSAVLNERGAKHILSHALSKADPESQYPIHLSFDVDVFDADDIASTGTRVKDGPFVQEIFSVGSILGETGRLRSMDLVELNPELGCEREKGDSFRLALDFTCSTLRKVFKTQNSLESVPRSSNLLFPSSAFASL